MTTRGFIDRARKAHGDRYDYSPTKFTTLSSKVRINCPVHSQFEQRADHHLRGHGCTKCAGKDQSSTQDFIAKAKIIHGTRYDYSQVDYSNAYTKITIISPEHGPFR